MITKIDMPSYIFSEMSLLVIFLVIGTSSTLPGINQWNRRFFMAFFSSLALGVSVFTIDMLTYMNPKTLGLSKWLPFIEYMLFPIPTILFIINLLHFHKEDWKKSVLFRAVLSLWAFYFILHVIAHFTTFFYYTSPDGRFFLKETHPLLFVPVIAISILGLAAVFLRRKEVSRRHFYASLLFLIPSTVATLIHSLFFSVLILNIAMCISSVAMYMLILTEQIDQYVRQQAAIANQNARIMVLQMRPHFLYNTMTSIYYLCDQNPKKAQQVILDLTSYLRKNFNAMVSNDTIPFSEELEHVRAYLAVELAQYEDNLFVEYDTPHTRFRLPPLTLQPLVENSIKHGMNPDSEPLHILIQTSETNSGSVIVVTDNGPGFEPKDVFNSHNALSNIKQRIEMMCDGNMTITSRKGEGTVVKMIIPQK